MEDPTQQQQQQQQQSTTTTTATAAASTSAPPRVLKMHYSLTPPPTPPAIKPTLRLSASLSPPPTPNPNLTPNRQRQAAWWQSSIVRRSSSAVDEAVDELTEKSQFLLRKQRSSTSLMTPRLSSSSSGEQLDCTLEEEECCGHHDDADDTTQEDEEVALFQREEILAGELLGEGTFNCVYEVVGFDLDELEEDPTGLRHQLATSKPTRFALKHLKPALLENTLQFEQAATDLVMEAKYMAALNHPNILKVHGEPLNGTAAINSGVDGYFLLTDRLSETLANRIERWTNGEAMETNTVSCKLSYAMQIAEALKYLHQQRILFRDLKPSNIGFHQQDCNRIQLFDFGLCRELPPRCQARPYVHGAICPPTMDGSEYSLQMEMELDLGESWNEDDPPAEPETDDIEQVYLMSGAGTQIYMAPEVLVQNRYNLKADVYSWAMTVSELLLLEKPLPHYEMEDHIQYVCIEGDRPSLHEEHPEIPESLRDLLAWAWEGDVSKRCTITQVCDELPEIIAEVEEDERAEDKREVVLSSSSWSSRLIQVATRIPQGLLSLLGRALERVSSLLFLRRRRGREISSTVMANRDVTFDLPHQDAEDEKVLPPLPEPTDTTTATALSPTQEDDENDDEEEDVEDEDVVDPSNSSSNSDCVLLSPRPTPRSCFSRSALLKRKTSSASTTAMTDDEFDDDYYDFGSPGGGGGGGGVGIPLSLSPPHYRAPSMPLEALVERHNSNASSAATCTTATT